MCRRRPRENAPRNPGSVPGGSPRLVKTGNHVWDLGTYMAAERFLTRRSARYDCMRGRQSNRTKVPSQIESEEHDRDQSLLLSIPEVATRLSFSRRTVETMIAGSSSNLPALRTVRLGSRVLVPREELVRLVDRLKADAGWRIR